VALAVVAVLLIAGVVLMQKLRSTSQLQDCLMSRATNCVETATPPVPATCQR
jgi:hypothetical protein